MNAAPQKILMLSIDEKIFDAHSDARARMRRYAAACNELHIIVLNGGRGVHARFMEGQLRVAATNSLFKFLAPLHAIRMGKKIARRAPLTAADSLVTAQDPFEIGFAGWRIARAAGLPLQLQVHTDFCSPFFANALQGNFVAIKNRARAALAKFLLRHADSVRVVSERVRASVEKIVHSAGACASRDQQKIFVQPIAVDTAAIIAASQKNLHAQFSEFEKIALVVSRLTREKNIESAVRAIAAVRADGHNVGLIIIGDGPLRTKFQHHTFVRTLGWVAEPAGYYKGADVFLNTSLYEGYGRTLIEAAAAGVPIITTDVGVAREIIREGENGQIIPVNNDTALSAALKKFLI